MSNKFEIMSKESDRVGESNDCSVKALAIACRVPYRAARRALTACGRRAGRGCSMPTIKKAIRALGCEQNSTYYPKQKNGNGFTMKTIGKGFSRGYYVVVVRGHVAAVVNGQVLDWTEGRQHRVTEVIKITVPRGSRSKEQEKINGE